MPRLALFAPLAGLLAAVAGVGLLLGGRAITTTETEVIDRVAGLYVSDVGGGVRRTACQARPARSRELWLVISCGPAGARHEYFVDRYGRVADVDRPGGAS
jgi:hypothetical protein